MPEIIIIGAGLTGLSTAHHLKKPFIVLEKKKVPGGLCASVHVDGCTFDHSGHFLHLHQPQTRKLIEKLISVQLLQVNRKAVIHFNSAFMPYPFQANLYHLPEQIKKECVTGFLNRNIRGSFPRGTPFLQWSRSVFGKGITKYFMKPYNEKLWTVPGNVLTSDWVAPFVPQPVAKDIINGAKHCQKRDYGYNVSFFYPQQDGCGAIVNGFFNNTSNIKLSVKAGEINLKKRTLLTSDGRKLHFNTLVSTQPLTYLLNSISGLPDNVKAASDALNWNSVECFNLAFKDAALDHKPVNGAHWVYFPEKKYSFYRAGIYSNVLSSMAPKGHFSMYIEVSRDHNAVFSRKAATNNVLKGLEHAGIISKGDKPAVVNVLSMPCAYVIYDKKRTAALKVIREYLSSNGVYSIGRYGAWEYTFMETNILEGKNTAEILNRS